jgi:DHA1 family tetracycline resistance protein-like MFS transporter
LPFWAAAAFSLTNFVYGYFVLPESLVPSRRTAFTWARANPLGALRLLSRNSRTLGLSIVSLLDSLALVSLPSTFVLYVTHKFGWSEQTVGFSFAGVGLGLAIVHGGLTGPVVAILGERSTLLAGIAFGACGFGMYGIAWDGYVIWCAIPLIALWGLSDSANQSLLSAEFGTREQGQLQGALSGLMSLAETFGPLLATQIYAAAIKAGPDVAPAGAPFLVAAGLQIIGLVLAYIVTRPPSAPAMRSTR